jgi:hypothetical protein
VITEAKQGHRYLFDGTPVIALASGERVRVLAFDPKAPWLYSVLLAHANQLEPQPMKYFHGQIPQ